MTDDERLIIVPVPSLVATLLRAERDKGAPLTESESEVIAIRDSCPSIVLSEKVAAEVIAERGYDDIDPDVVWESWQAIQPTLADAAKLNWTQGQDSFLASQKASESNGRVSVAFSRTAWFEPLEEGT